MKKILLLLGLVTCLTTSSQPVLHWRFADYTEYGDWFYYYTFNIEISCTNAGTFHSSLWLSVEYDTIAFGSYVISKGNVTIEPLDLLQGSFMGMPKYSFTILADDGPNRILLKTHANWLIAGSAFMNEVPTLYYGQLLKMVFKIRETSINGFFTFDENQMNATQYYIDASHSTETKYGIPPTYVGVYENQIMSLMGCHGTWYDLKVNLQGAYDTSLHVMRTDLAANGFLPHGQPFHPPLPYFNNWEPCWYYEGNESTIVIPDSVVDWVMIEVRDAPDIASALSSTCMTKGAFFLKANGQIVDVNGYSSIEFNTNRLITEGMFVIIYGRNHLGIINPQSIVPNKNSDCYGVSYNFTTGPDKAYGGILALTELEPGVWGMYAGDGNADGQVSNADKLEVWKVQSGNSGYLAGDFNMDAQVNNADKIDFWAPNSGRSCQVP